MMLMLSRVTTTTGKDDAEAGNGGDASTYHFLQQVHEQTAALRDEAAAARQDRDEADERLAQAESKLEHSLEVIRALTAYIGETTDTPEKGSGQSHENVTEGSEGGGSTIERAIVEVLTHSGPMSPIEITDRLKALGITHSPGSVRARLGKLAKQGVVQRDASARYRLHGAEPQD